MLFIATTAAMADETAVSFKTRIQLILDSPCVFCHVTGAENDGLNLGRSVAQASLLAASTEAPMPRVTPGSPEQRYLLHKLRGTEQAAGGSGNRMPMTVRHGRSMTARST